jgi:hypothetical protein
MLDVDVSLGWVEGLRGYWFQCPLKRVRSGAHPLYGLFLFKAIICYMEIDHGRDEFVLEELDREVLLDTSMKMRYNATLENAILLRERAEVVQKVLSVIKEVPLTSSVESLTVQKVRGVAEEATTRIPQILGVLSPFIDQNITKDIEVYLQDDPGEG